MMFIEVILLSVEEASRLVDVIIDAVTNGFLLVAIEFADGLCRGCC